LLASLVEAIGGATPERCDDGPVVVGGAKLRADTEHRRERGCDGEPTLGLIDLVFEACEALSVRTGLALQYDGEAVRHDQPRPARSTRSWPKDIGL
jgi:hypothetical protein